MMQTDRDKMGRRDALLLIGSVTALAASCGDDSTSATGATGGEGGGGGAGGGGACALAKELEEGPFYVDEGLLRSDIKEGESGVPLELTVTVVDATTCAPIANAAVDIWHASSLGEYSDEAQEGTTGQTFLRGVQLTDDEGVATFTTIYPGWYSGRTCHIHIKVHTGGTAQGSTYSSEGGTVVHGGQMFFPSDVNEALRSVYADNTNSFVNNDADNIYQQGGAASILTLDGSLTDGFTGSLTVAVDV